MKPEAPNVWPKGSAVIATILAAYFLSGCAGIGPQTVARDRFDYVSAISDS